MSYSLCDRDAKSAWAGWIPIMSSRPVKVRLVRRPRRAGQCMTSGQAPCICITPGSEPAGFLAQCTVWLAGSAEQQQSKGPDVSCLTPTRSKSGIVQPVSKQTPSASRQAEEGSSNGAAAFADGAVRQVPGRSQTCSTSSDWLRPANHLLVCSCQNSEFTITQRLQPQGTVASLALLHSEWVAQKRVTALQCCTNAASVTTWCTQLS